MKNRNIRKLTSQEQREVSGGSSNSPERNVPLGHEYDFPTRSDGSLPVPFITLGVNEDGGMFSTF